MKTEKLVRLCHCFFMSQVDNQLIGTTQPFMLYVTPLSNENEVIETGPAVQVNAVKFPSKSALTNIYKVGWWTCFVLSQTRLRAAVQAADGNSPGGKGTSNSTRCVAGLMEVSL